MQDLANPFVVYGEGLDEVQRPISIYLEITARQLGVVYFSLFVEY